MISIATSPQTAEQKEDSSSRSENVNVLSKQTSSQEGQTRKNKMKKHVHFDVPDQPEKGICFFVHNIIKYACEQLFFLIIDFRRISSEANNRPTTVSETAKPKKWRRQ